MKATPDSLTVATRTYRRAFERPLRAAWGDWSIREGTLIQVQDPGTGKLGFGECASLPGSSSSAASDSEDPQPDPAREFGECSALMSLSDPPENMTPVKSAALLSLLGSASLDIASLREQGYQTFKLKVGLADIEQEWKDLQHLITTLHPGEKLRLDPNRSWKKREWQFWKPRLNGVGEWIQFIEEPFTRHFPAEGWLREAETSPIPLALDESLAGDGLDYWLSYNWPGFWIIKPSLLGNPELWMSRIFDYANRVVLSSAFESGIGLSAVIRIAQQFPGIDHGLGTQDYFNDDFGVPQEGNRLTPLTIEQQKDLWERIPQV